MKYSIIVATLAMGVSGVQAQSASESTASLTVSTPETFTISPSIASGVRTKSEGKITGGGGATTVGPFVRPAAALNLKNSKASATLAYEFEASSAMGLGANKDSMSQNLFYQHKPALIVSGGILPDWKLLGFLEMRWKFDNGNRNNSESDINLIPEIEYAVTRNVSVSAGYWMQRFSSFEGEPNVSEADPTRGRAAMERAKAAIEKNGAQAADLPRQAKYAVSDSAVGEKPTSTLHAGLVTTRIKMGDQKLTTYFRAGKRASNVINETTYNYRFQTHLDFVTGVEGLTGAVRYRLNIEDKKNSKDYKYYNLGLVDLSYALTDNWALNLSNEFVATQTSVKTDKASFENENYIGATFTF